MFRALVGLSSDKLDHVECIHCLKIMRLQNRYQHRCNTEMYESEYNNDSTFEKTIKHEAKEIAYLVCEKNRSYDNAFNKSIDEHGTVAFLIRLDDKINRLKYLINNNPQFEYIDESLEDALRDIIGYSLLALERYQNSTKLTGK